MNPIHRLCLGACSIVLAAAQPGLAADDHWEQARANAADTHRVVKFCHHYAMGWLSHADPTTGLLPRTVKGEAYWNAKDCAADNYPFIVLTAHITDNYHLWQAALAILEQEQKLTNRLDALPDDFDFATQAFRTDEYKLDRLIFGASEYAKDGLMPITEWLGPGRWSARMEQLIGDVWKHATYDSPAGKLASRNVEVNGELLQVMSRLYWMTGDEKYREWTFRLADYYLLHHDLRNDEQLRLRDHGCEIVGGLSEAYVVAAQTDPDRHELYRAPMHGLLDRILELGVNENGLMYNIVNPRDGEVTSSSLADTWGYVYDAFLTVAEIDDVERYRDAVVHVLTNLHRYDGEDWTKSVDEYADAVEGAINLLNRIPVESAFPWVDRMTARILDAQRHDGIIEGWYGDGNSARTAWMYALWKTQGVTAAPWREDVQLGAVRDADGRFLIHLHSEWAWSGELRFDRPRHKEILHLPMDYPRINQFPEWFTVEAARDYDLQIDDGEATAVKGKTLLAYPSR